MAANPAWIGRPIRVMEEHLGARIGYLLRFGQGMIPDDQTVYQDSDILNVICAAGDLSRVERRLEVPPSA